jgi:hypothetical protein
MYKFSGLLQGSIHAVVGVPANSKSSRLFNNTKSQVHIRPLFCGSLKTKTFLHFYCGQLLVVSRIQLLPVVMAGQVLFAAPALQLVEILLPGTARASGCFHNLWKTPAARGN